MVERLLAAGALLIGKTNLDQFATGLVGVRSPYGKGGRSQLYFTDRNTRVKNWPSFKRRAADPLARRPWKPRRSSVV